MALDSYSQRGVGLNAEYRYILSRNTQGIATGFFIQETEVKDDLRGYAHVRHDPFFEERRSPGFGPVKNLVREDHVARTQVLAQAAAGRNGNDLLDSKSF